MNLTVQAAWGVLPVVILSGRGGVVKSFSTVELVLQMSRAACSMGKKDMKEKMTETGVQAQQWRVFLSILGETQDDKKQSGFVFNYYVPYFSEMNKRDLKSHSSAILFREAS